MGTRNKGCIVSGCDKKHKYAGLCNYHYMLYSRNKENNRDVWLTSYNLNRTKDNVLIDCTLGEDVRRYVHRKGITLKSLASVMGISYPLMVSVVNGRVKASDKFKNKLKSNTDFYEEEFRNNINKLLEVNREVYLHVMKDIILEEERLSQRGGRFNGI